MEIKVLKIGIDGKTEIVEEEKPEGIDSTTIKKIPLDFEKIVVALIEQGIIPTREYVEVSE